MFERIANPTLGTNVLVYQPAKWHGAPRTGKIIGVKRDGNCEILVNLRQMDGKELQERIENIGLHLPLSHKSPGTKPAVWAEPSVLIAAQVGEYEAG